MRLDGSADADRSDQFACERGHTLDGGTLGQLSSARVTTALWMAIEALETEAQTLRILRGVEGQQLADTAAQDAEILRRIAGAHLPEVER